MSVVVALALMFAPAAKFPGLLVEGGFMTPSGNIACNVGLLGPGTHGPRAIGCAVYSLTGKR